LRHLLCELRIPAGIGGIVRIPPDTANINGASNYPGYYGSPKAISPARRNGRDTIDRRYQFTVRKAVPWEPQRPKVLDCANVSNDTWCKGINVLAVIDPNRKKALQPDEIKELVGLAHSGLPKADLARRYGINREAVYQYLRRGADSLIPDDRTPDPTRSVRWRHAAS
jgi:hypothetical protein